MSEVNKGNRDRVTDNLDTNDQGQQPGPAVDLTAAKSIADRLHQVLVGYMVSRTYHFPDWYSPSEKEIRQPRGILVTRVVLDETKAQIVIFDNLGSSRIFPLAQFRFDFRPDNNGVIAIGPKFSVGFLKLLQ